MVRNVCGRYRHRGREAGGREAGVGAELIDVKSAGLPDIDVAAVLGGLADPPNEDGFAGLLPIDAMLSPMLPLLLDCVIVITDMRVPAAPDMPVRSVAESLPSCVAAPSRRSCTKYGPHLRPTMRELMGMRSPPMQRISMSASSRRAKAFSPSSSAARVW